MGQLILKTNTVTAAGSSRDNAGSGNGSSSESIGNVPSMLSTPMSGQPFQFNNPFQELFQRQNSQQQESAATTPVVLAASSLSSEHRLSPHAAPSSFSPLLKRSSWFSDQNDTNELREKTSISSKESTTRADQSPSRTENVSSVALAERARVQSSPTKARLFSGVNSRESPSPQQVACAISEASVSKQALGTSQKLGLNISCDICQAMFSGSQQMMRHRCTHFDKDRPQQQLKCNVCHKTFHLEALLKRHQMAESHLASAMLKPPMLSSQRSEDVRDREEEEVRKKEPTMVTQLACTFCTMLFQDRSELANHLRSKKHVNALEQLGMLPVGTYEKLRQDYEEVNSPLKETSIQPTGYGLSFGEQSRHSFAITAQKEYAKSSELVSHLASVTSSVSSPEKLDPVRRNMTNVENLRVSQSVADFKTTHPGFTEYKRSNSGEGSHDHALKAKKPRLQLVTLNSVDSDPDGDCHLVIDESRIEISGKKSPDLIPESEFTICVQKSLKTSSASQLVRSTALIERHNSDKLEETSCGFEAVDTEVRQEMEERG